MQGQAPTPDADLDRQRELVEAFLAASREGNFDGLLAVLDPDVVLRADSGALPPPATQEGRGAEQVAHLAAAFSEVARYTRPALVNGTPGLLATTPSGEPYSVMGFTVTDGRIVEIDILADPERLAKLDLLDSTTDDSNGKENPMPAAATTIDSERRERKAAVHPVLI